MRYLQTMKKMGPGSVRILLAQANNEVETDVEALINKWGHNGDISFLAAALRKVLPLIETTMTDNEKELAKMIAEKMDPIVVSITEPEKGEQA